MCRCLRRTSKTKPVVQIPEPLETNLTLIPESERLVPQIHSLVGFTEAQQKKMEESIVLCCAAMNTVEFRHRVLAYRFQAPPVQSELVYRQIMSGDDLYGTADKDLDVHLTLYYSWKNVVAYTYENTPRVYINSKFFNVWPLYKIAGNIAHEVAAHNAGFTHSYKNSPYRKHSVPYAVQLIVEDIAKKISKGL